MTVDHTIKLKSFFTIGKDFNNFPKQSIYKQLIKLITKMQNSAQTLRGNIFDLKKLHHLKMVNSLKDLSPNKTYWAVQNRNGVVFTNWKVKVTINYIFGDEFDNHTILGETAIMDDNFVCQNVYDLKSHTFFEYEM